MNQEEFIKIERESYKLVSEIMLDLPPHVILTVAMKLIMFVSISSNMTKEETLNIITQMYDATIEFYENHPGFKE